MKEQYVLAGCIQSLTSTKIRTRFFFIDSKNGTIQDVTNELCQAIETYNKYAKSLRSKGYYAVIIPFRYKNGLAEYPFGSGLSHHLQEEMLEEISTHGQPLSFPLAKCMINMYAPIDVKYFLGCKDVFDDKIEKSLMKRFLLKGIA